MSLLLKPSPHYWRKLVDLRWTMNPIPFLSIYPRAASFQVAKALKHEGKLDISIHLLGFRFEERVLAQRRKV